jgi:hypothetical protein
MTYLDELLKILQDGEEHILDKDDIMKSFHACKLHHVIEAIKKGLTKGLIARRDNPESKLLWKGHYFSIVKK